MMNRRSVLAGAVSVVAAPLGAEAQVAGRTPRIGYLAIQRSALTLAFEQGLQDLGWEDGRNIVVEWRETHDDPTRLAAFAAELVRLNVDVIVAPDELRVNAVRQASHTIPVVFNVVGDPVRIGYAASLRRPGGMLTGLSSQWYDLGGKRLEILKETIPQAQPVAVLTSPPGAPGAYAMAAAGLKNLEAAAQSLRLSSRTYLATEPGDLDSAFAAMARDGARSVAMLTNTSLIPRERKRIADLALRYRLPTMAEGRFWVEAGCLMSYAANTEDLFRRAATYVDRILKGAKPGDLPIEQPTKFEFVINLIWKDRRQAVA
jgi:putative ABC transport system substrate-binding protein